MRRKKGLNGEIYLIIIGLLEKFENMWRMEINWDIIKEFFVINSDVIFFNFFTESN